MAVGYAQGGGLTDGERTARERIRLQAVARRGRGEEQGDSRRVAGERAVGGAGGAGPGASAAGPGCCRRARRTGRSSARYRLERELERGPLVHGWADQRWTPARAKTLIGRLFHVSCTVEETWRLPHRHRPRVCTVSGSGSHPVVTVCHVRSDSDGAVRGRALSLHPGTRIQPDNPVEPLRPARLAVSNH